jgi:nucleoid DNA-binding protein
MNKQELIVETASRCSLTQRESKELMDATFDVLAGILSKEDSLTIQNFGTFGVHLRKSHRFFNPFRSVMMLAPKKLAVAFHPSKSFNDRVNEKMKP